MIFDYYNIICPDCNSRLTNRCEELNFFKTYCDCKQYNRTEFVLYKKTTLTIITILKNTKLIFEFNSNNVEFKDSFITVHTTLISAFGNLSIDKQKELRDYYINKPYLSEVYNEFMKIIKTYKNNLIFL